MDNLRNARAERLAWGLVGLVAFAAVAFVVYSFVGAIVSGVFLYYATRPVYRWLDGRSDHGDINATITLLVVGLPILLVLSYATLVGGRELDAFLRTNQLDQYRSLLRPYVDLAELADPQRLYRIAQENTGRLLSLVSAASTWLLRLFVVVVVAFYLLRDDDAIASWARETFDDDYDAVAFLERVDDDLSTLYTGNLITIAITGGVAVATFYAFDALAPGNPIAYPILLGFLVGVATLVPVFGIKLVYFPFTAYLLVRSLVGDAIALWLPVAFFLVTVVVVDFVPDLFIRSYVSKGELNMGLVLLAYVLGTVAFGWYGIFLGPIVLVFFLHFARHVLPNVVDGDAAHFVSE